MEYVSRFPMPSHFLLTANEKDFSLALEMTVRESGILASLPYLRHNKMPQIPCGYSNTNIEFTAIIFGDICHVYLDRGLII